jgi:hypothetical protein
LLETLPLELGELEPAPGLALGARGVGLDDLLTPGLELLAASALACALGAHAHEHDHAGEQRERGQPAGHDHAPVELLDPAGPVFVFSAITSRLGVLDVRGERVVLAVGRLSRLQGLGCVLTRRRRHRLASLASSKPTRS